MTLRGQSQDGGLSTVLPSEAGASTMGPLSGQGNRGKDGLQHTACRRRLRRRGRHLQPTCGPWGGLAGPSCGPAASGVWGQPGLGPWRLLSGNPLSTDLIFVLLQANLLILPAPGACAVWRLLIHPRACPSPAGGLLSPSLGEGVVGMGSFPCSFPQSWGVWASGAQAWIWTLSVPCSAITSSPSSEGGRF